MNPNQITLFKNMIAAKMAKARRTGKLVAYSPGGYFAKGRDGRLWEITSRSDEGLKGWDVKALDAEGNTTHVHLDPVKTLREALKQIGNGEQA